VLLFAHAPVWLSANVTESSAVYDVCRCWRLCSLYLCSLNDKHKYVELAAVRADLLGFGLVIVTAPLQDYSHSFLIDQYVL
jgi:hypothetical protein